MAITEDYLSRETIESFRGATMTRVWTMLHTDYNNVFDIYDGDLLGDSPTLDDDFSASDINLRVVQIRQNALDNKNTKVTVNYSTENAPAVEAVPDSANSWKEEFDISTVTVPVDGTYFDYTSGSSGAWSNWDTVWANKKPAGSSDTVPELVIREERMVFSVTAYASTLYADRIRRSLKRINGVNFLLTYFANNPQSSIAHDTLSADALQWLFTSCPIVRTGKNVWRYDFTFESSGDFTYGWNEGAGFNTGRYNNKSPFNNNLFDFNDLFSGMDDNPSTDVSVDTGRP